MRRDYNNLVRDRINEIIRASGKRCSVETLSEPKYRQALQAKLVEEAQEACGAAPDELLTELANLQEVIVSVLAAWHISPEKVQQIQDQRRAERGGFEQRLKLLWTKDGDEDV